MDTVSGDSGAPPVPCARSEGWQSGRMRRSRKPLSVVRRIEGSNPSPSAQISPGGVSERSKERDWKSRMCRKVHRGFKSLSLRLTKARLGGLSVRKEPGTMRAPGEVAEWLKAAPC